jgi:hypothetical protein
MSTGAGSGIEERTRVSVDMDALFTSALGLR